MAFALGVELVNMRISRNSKTKTDVSLKLKKYEV
jgi:hypothetical protein